MSNKIYIMRRPISVMACSHLLNVNVSLKVKYTVEPRYLELAYFELPLISK